MKKSLRSILLCLAIFLAVEALPLSASPEALIKAEALVKEGRIKEAISEYLNAARQDPACAEAYDRLAYLYMTEGRRQEAEEAARHALSLKATLPVSNNILGMLEERHGNLATAEELYKKAIQESPSYSRAYNNLGNICLKRGDFQRAEENYRKAISYEEGLAMAHNNLAYTLEFEGNLKDAEKEYERALALEPRLEIASLNLKRLRAKASQPPATEEDRRIAESICAYRLPEGFRLLKGLKPDDGGKVALFEYRYYQRVILRELPADSPFNEAVFTQMIMEYKKELLNLLEGLVSMKSMKITGQGYYTVGKEKVLAVLTESESEGTSVDGMFTLVTRPPRNRSILIVSLAPKGMFRKDVSERFLKGITFEKKG
ncbi:MAG: tetratricopeptide repeat protein [Candidatus Eremiobacteraeota bacterium]|nr:tetratricopeptide repeat protein [Candidatus Eremiobacteraeota bacterium]